MTRIEREELLRRYLNGEMGLEQEHDFLIQVALDKELRHELKAQQTIDRAFQKDKVVDPSSYASLQGKVAMMLTTVAQEPNAAQASVGKSSAPSLRFGRWVVAGALLLSLLIGGYALFQNTSSVAEYSERAVPSFGDQSIDVSIGIAPHVEGPEMFFNGVHIVSKANLVRMDADVPVLGRSSTAQDVPAQATVQGSVQVGGSPATILEQSSASPSVDIVSQHATVEVPSALDDSTDDSIKVGVNVKWNLDSERSPER